jgi:hypothetical protein
MPSADKLKSTQKILDEFAVGNMNLARDRVTLPVAMGGLGLFCIEKFLISQQAKWVFKAYNSSRDNWQYMLRCLSNGNALSVHPDLIKKEANPVLYGISSSYSQFRVALDSSNSNFLNAFIIGNLMFFRGPREKSTLNLSYLDSALASCAKDLSSRLMPPPKWIPVATYPVPVPDPKS